MFNLSPKDFSSNRDGGNISLLYEFYRPLEGCLERKKGQDWRTKVPFHQDKVPSLISAAAMAKFKQFGFEFVPHPP